MVKQVSCREAGMDCDFLVRDENEDELIELVQRHAENTHGMEMSRSDVREYVTEAN
jgi:predicted small metal-binding protein